MDKNEARYNIAKVADTLFGSLEKNLGNICEVEGPYYTIAGLGSGFDIGRKAIIAATRSHDGRGEKPELEELDFHSLGLKGSLWEVCSIHNRPSFRKDVSSLTRAVETACGHSDRAALEIAEKPRKRAFIGCCDDHGKSRIQQR